MSLRRLNLAGLGVLLCTLVIVTFGVPMAGAGPKVAVARTVLSRFGAEIVAYEQATWRWQETMGVPLTPTAGRSLAAMSLGDVRGALHVWQRRAHAARVRATHPPRLAAWLCIHRLEGSWTEGYGPYYGGLQMDIGFQQRYAPRLYRRKGTADHWTPLEQIWTAVRAARTRGFWPWPNTARACGVL